MSLVSVCCLPYCSANWLHITFIAYDFWALQYTHCQHVIVTLDVDIWPYGVAMELKGTGTL